MPKFKLTLKGNKAVLSGLEKVSEKARKNIELEIEASGNEIRNDAVSRVAVNNGILKNSISLQVKGLDARIEVGSNYAAYIEFGTGTKVSVPAHLQDYAKQFQGKSTGTWEEFEENIEQWMKQKSIDLKLKWIIMATIYKYGIEPQPFLFPAFEKERPELIKNIKRVLKELK